MTHIIYLKQNAIRAEARTSTSNRKMSVLYDKNSDKRIESKHSLITHILERETVNYSAIKFALSFYEPISQLEYE